ncbi:MAG TPA: response regulator [Anaerolineales bacterium]|nr:response regulator [Anaerolineales bacterium]
MAPNGDRILLVESDPEIIDLVARQVLISQGYDVDVVADSSSAIKQTLPNPPDLIIADLNLPTLSAKDLLVALTAQGINTPLLVIASKGQEQDIIQAFRLGAADYLLWPARDAEVLAAVDRVLNRVRATRDRQRLDQKLNELNLQFQRKLGELNTIISLGKAVVSVTDQRVLFQKVVDAAAQVADANMTWLLVRDDDNRSFVLAAQRGLPEVWAKKMNLPLDDGISGLVALSGETLSISGEPLVKFRVSTLGKSACAVPVKVQKEVIGMLVVVRKDARPFQKPEQTLLEAVGDYASISLVNARLFRVLNTSTQTAKEVEKRQSALLESMRHSITEELQAAIYPIDLLLAEKNERLSDQQRQALQTARMALQRLARSTERTMPPIPPASKKK